MKSKTFLKTIALFPLFSCLTSCSTGKADLIFSPGEDKSFAYHELENESFVKLRNSVDSFSAKVSEKLFETYDDDVNIAFSPVSIYLDLGLGAKAGAGNTRNEILDALNIDYETLNQNYGLLYRSLNDEFDEGQSLITNSIWLNPNLKFKEDALKELATDYFCYSYLADFTSDNKNANLAITNFIKEHTKGLLSPDLKLDTTTNFVLLNTLYLKDVWNALGEDLRLYPNKMNFKNSDGSLRSNKDFLSGYYETGLTFENQDFSSFFAKTFNDYRLVFIKPDEGKTLKDVFIEKNINLLLNHSFSEGAIDDENMLIHKTRAIFPEFEASFDKDIKDFIDKEFNVNDLFNENCDFSTILENHVGNCTAIKHITKLKVDRKGIEGAAITAMVAASSPAPLYEEVYHDFILDRDFGFLVLDTYNNILFSGAVEKI